MEDILSNINEQTQIRLNKLNNLIKNKQNPFEITKYDNIVESDEIISNYSSYENTNVNVAGRLMAKRIMGGSSFASIQDSKYEIQLFVSKKEIGDENYLFFKDLDIGDIIGVNGDVFKTKTGEITIRAKTVTLLTKSLLVLPEKFHGLKDEDIKYRQRELDMIMNRDVKQTFILRSKIINEIRQFLNNNGYLEVDTPILQPLEIGSSARPFVTHHNALNIDMYLRIETELYLKRLVVGGIHKVYEIGRIFRNEGMDRTHNPEFTSLEMYQAYANYYDMMDIIENLFKTVTYNVLKTYVIYYQDYTIDMSKKWTRLSMVNAVRKYASVNYYDWQTDEQAVQIAKEYNVELEKGDNSTKGEVLVAFFETFVEKNLIQPTIIYDYPIEISPLAKKKKDNELFTERFEFFIYGKEIGNAFSELNDPIDQYQRFKKQVEEKNKNNENQAKIDMNFIRSLLYGLPPTGGLGFGIDRFIMLLTNKQSIRDVILFPTLKNID